MSGSRALRKVARVRLAAIAALALLAVGCSSGADAPTFDGTEEVCIPDFCVNYPSGWSVAETGPRFVAFAHPAGEDVIATVGRVNLEGITVNAGGTWPVPARDVVDLLWMILDGGDAELASVDLIADGALDSWGAISTGRLWHRLIPISASRGFGVEVRAPNSSWETHADIFRQNLVVLNEDLS